MNDKEREYIQSLTDQEAVDCVIKEIDELRQGLCCKTVVLDEESKIT